MNLNSGRMPEILIIISGAVGQSLGITRIGTVFYFIDTPESLSDTLAERGSQLRVIFTPHKEGKEGFVDSISLDGNSKVRRSGERKIKPCIFEVILRGISKVPVKANDLKPGQIVSRSPYLEANDIENRDNLFLVAQGPYPLGQIVVVSLHGRENHIDDDLATYVCDVELNITLT